MNLKRRMKIMNNLPEGMTEEHFQKLRILTTDLCIHTMSFMRERKPSIQDGITALINVICKIIERDTGMSPEECQEELARLISSGRVAGKKEEDSFGA